MLELLKELVADLDTAMIMITHDLGVVAGLCDFVNVMYAGRIVESASRRELFAHPRHRYTEGLLASIPRLDSPARRAVATDPGHPARRHLLVEGLRLRPALRSCRRRLRDSATWRCCRRSRRSPDALRAPGTGALSAATQSGPV